MFTFSLADSMKTERTKSISTTFPLPALLHRSLRRKKVVPGYLRREGRQMHRRDRQSLRPYKLDDCTNYLVHRSLPAAEYRNVVSCPVQFFYSLGCDCN